MHDRYPAQRVQRRRPLPRPYMLDNTQNLACDWLMQNGFCGHRRPVHRRKDPG
jgi:hypothetical protein